MSAVFKHHKSRQRTNKSTGRFFSNRFRHGRLQFEELEQRQLLAAVIWVGGTGVNGNNWDVGTNWLGGSVPGTGDAVSIALPSATTVIINAGDNESIGSLTTGSTDTLKITGGNLTVSAPSTTSTLSGALTMTGGTLTASGAGVNLTVNGTTTISDANLSADNGGALTLPGITKYDSGNNTFRGNRLEFATWAAESGDGDTGYWQLGGQRLERRGDQPIGFDESERDCPWMYFTDTGGSTIVNTKLTSLMGVTVTTDGSDTQLANAWTSFTNDDTLTVTGGSYNLSGLTSVNDSTLVTQSGGVLTLPGITKYDSGNNTFEATGSNSGLWAAESDDGDTGCWQLGGQRLERRGDQPIGFDESERDCPRHVLYRYRRQHDCEYQADVAYGGHCYDGWERHAVSECVDEFYQRRHPDGHGRVVQSVRSDERQ